VASSVGVEVRRVKDCDGELAVEGGRLVG